MPSFPLLVVRPPATPWEFPTEVHPLPGFEGQRGVEGWFLALLRGSSTGATLARAGAQALAWPYGAGVRLYRRLYEDGWLPRHSLPRPVVSVGNLTLGGTGKTPCVLWLARWLQGRGRRVSVLLRGHRRRGRKPWQVVSDGERLIGTPAEVGDEAYLLAAKLPGAAVVVGKRREVTGRWAIAEWGAEVVLLDDGFQYWPLSKTRDIVLLDALEPPRRLCLFPAGILREPQEHLRYAHEFWLTRVESAPAHSSEEWEAFLQDRFPHRPLRRVEQRVVGMYPLRHDAGGRPLLAPQEKIGPESLRGQSVAAFCGIGRPLAFVHTLLRLGPSRLWVALFPDHHPYSPGEVEAVAQAARGARAQWLLTTEKDAARCPPTRATLPVWVLEIDVALFPEPSEEELLSPA